MDERKSIPEIPSSGSPIKIILIFIGVALIGGLATWFVVDQSSSNNNTEQHRVETFRKHPTPVLVEEIPTEPGENEQDKILDSGVDIQSNEKTNSKKVVKFTRLPEGKIDAKLVQKFINSKSTEVKRCYEKAVKINNFLQGSLSIETTIHPTGRVLRTDVTKDTIFDKTIKECVVQLLKSWTFPQPEGGIVKIAIPFRFTPKQEN